MENVGQKSLSVRNVPFIGLQRIFTAIWKPVENKWREKEANVLVGNAQLVDLHSRMSKVGTPMRPSFTLMNQQSAVIVVKMSFMDTCPSIKKGTVKEMNMKEMKSEFNHKFDKVIPWLYYTYLQCPFFSGNLSVKQNFNNPLYCDPSSFFILHFWKEKTYYRKIP